MQYVFLLFIISLIIIILIINYPSNNPNLFIMNVPVKLMDAKHIVLRSQDNVQRSLNDEQLRSLPSAFDAWNSVVPIVDQGPWGSCTAFSLRYAYLLNLANKNLTFVEPSTSFLYDQARIRENNTSLIDSGATNSDIAWVVQNMGIPPLSSFPYTAYNLFHAANNLTNLTKFSMSHLIFSSNIITNVANMKNILYSKKGLIVAIYVYPSMMTTNVYISGIVPQPSTSEKPIGGHSITLTGWDDTKQIFIFRNSWGTYTGNSGVFTIPYNYAANPKYTGDAWYFTN